MRRLFEIFYIDATLEVPRVGLEPTTLRSSGECSSQLSYLGDGTTIHEKTLFSKVFYSLAGRNLLISIPSKLLPIEEIPSAAFRIF